MIVFLLLAIIAVTLWVGHTIHDHLNMVSAHVQECHDKEMAALARLREQVAETKPLSRDDVHIAVRAALEDIDRAVVKFEANIEEQIVYWERCLKSPDTSRLSPEFLVLVMNDVSAHKQFAAMGRLQSNNPETYKRIREKLDDIEQRAAKAWMAATHADDTGPLVAS